MAAAGVAAHDVAPGKAGRARLRRGGDWDSIGVRELRSQLADARLPIGLSLQLPHAADVAVVEMASSNAGQLGQHGRPPTTSDSENTFASYLEHRRNTRQCQPWVLDKHPKLRQKPGAWCAHCKQSEDLINSPVPPAAPPYPNGSREHAVSWRPDAGVPPHELALEGRSCSRCAADVFLKTRRLRDAAPAGSGGNTPLHHAARSGNLRMLFHLVTLLGLDSLEVGHDRVAEALRKTNERRETALHVAVSVGDRDMVRLLLWVDPRLGQIACHGTSLIYLAVSQGDEDIARQLHDASCPHDADMMSSYSGSSGQNALHAAVLHGKGMTRMVLRFKKDLCTGKDQNGSTPLHFAVSVKQRTYIPRWCFRHTWWQNVLKSFQKRIVNNVPIWPLLETDSSMAYQPDNEGLLPVHVAAITDQTVAVHILLTECSKCMGLRDNKGRTFLHVAVQHKGLSVVRYACRRPECASIMNIPDNDGNTALHLAVVAGNLRMFCDLLTNRQVCLNLKNNKGQTALDLATGQIPQGFFYGRNQDQLIYGTLTRVGAKHSSCRGDKLIGRQDDPGAEAEQKTAEQLDKEESAKLTDASRTLAVGSVLIATMTFSATFTRLPGGYITAGAAPALAGTWFFDAFVVSSALAFILASAATVGLMYSGIAMVELPIRRKHFLVSLFFVSSSITCLTTAFALGVYIVLAPVARVTAIVIGAISPLLLIYRNGESLQKLGAVSGPLLARMGFWVWLRWSGGALLLRILKKLWPFAVIFGLAGHL